jgi:ABC-type uncharacterized transport system fused permease/ATPase subunit
MQSRAIFATALLGVALLSKRLGKKRTLEILDSIKIVDVVRYHVSLTRDILDPSRMREEKKDPVRRLFGLLWPKNFGDEGARLILTMFIVGILRTAHMHQSFNVLRALTSAVHERSSERFKAQLGKAAVLTVCGSAIGSLSVHAKEALAILWRSKLSQHVHNLYFSSMAYYALGNLSGREAIVDPEERLSREIYSVTKRLTQVISLFARSIPHVAWFTLLLWRSRGTNFALIPHLYLSLAYEVAQRIFPKDLGDLYRKSAIAQGGYSQSVSRLRNQGECVAALGGDAVERSILDSRMGGVGNAQAAVHAALNRFGLTFKMAYVYGCRSWMTSFVMLPFMRAEAASHQGQEISSMRHTLGLLMEMLIANGELLTAHAQARHMAGTCYRITQLIDTLQRLNVAYQNASAARPQGEAELRDSSAAQREDISFDQVDIVTPTGHPLVKSLSFRVAAGGQGKLLLTGQNGAGKSSIFRCLGGLWRIPKGAINKPGGGTGLHSSIFYLPQKPYNVIGTLAAQLCYPEEPNVSHQRVRELLACVDLLHLLDEGEGPVNWEEVLSLGEQQRLAIARLFFHRPVFAVLDECTSATSAGIEQFLYDEMDRLGISYITICHRPALRQYHTTNLHLSGDGNGGWIFQELEPVERDERKSLARSSSAPHLVPPHPPGAAVNSDGQPLASSNAGAPVVRRRSALGKLAAITRILFPRTSRRIAMLCLAIVVRTGMHHLYGKIVGEIFKATLSRDPKRLLFFSAVNFVQDFFTAYVDELTVSISNKLSLEWQNLLSQHATELLFRNKAYHAVTAQIPDWDSRVASEISEVTTTLSSLIGTAVSPAIDAIFFGSRLWNSVGIQSVAILGAYVSAVGLATRIMSPNHAALNSREKELEARYRYVHTRLRQHAESIAFFDGGAAEKQIADDSLRSLIAHQRKMRGINSRFNFFVYSISKDYDGNTGPSISTAVCIPEVLSQFMQLRFVEQAHNVDGAELASSTFYVSTAVSRSLTAFGKISSVVENLVSLMGSSTRVLELFDGLDSIRPPKSSSAIEADHIQFEHVDLCTPDRSRRLASDLNFHLNANESLLVTGPNGSGKTAVFRVLAGLWPAGNEEARIARPQSKSLFLIPQKPYSVPGSLASQVTYPNFATPADAEAVLQALSRAGIRYLAERFEGGLNAVQRWEDTLSLGEQQRLGFARVFFTCPKFVVLDECSDAVSAEVEEGLFRTLHEMGISCITISKRLALPQYHNYELALGVNNPNLWSLDRLNSKQ